jgi:hypothetical protein
MSEPQDPFKDSLLRYAGYANELGEAFRSFLPHYVVTGTYVVAATYGMADASHKAYLAFHNPANAEKKFLRAADRFGYTALYVRTRADIHTTDTDTMAGGS